MRGLVLDAKWEPRPDYALSDWEKETGKAITGRAAPKVPMYLEAFQVRRSQAYGAQGHSGHETFPNVIRLVGAGQLDTSPIVTARYDLDATVEAIVRSIDRTDGKIMVKPS